MKQKTLVLKFGGASVATPEQFDHIADIVISKKKDYQNIVVVLSAMGNNTNELIQLAKKVHPNPPQREYDMLLTVGERISISLLAMSLAKKEIKARSFTGSQSGIITTDNHSNAEIIDVKPHRLLSALESDHVVIVAGFQGVSKYGEITTLGRGGSDTTAVALAIALNAEKVEFYKDVEGIYDVDPKTNCEAHLYKELNYDQALEIVAKGSKILNHRSLILAKKNNIILHVLSFINKFAEGTIIGYNCKDKNLPIYELDETSFVP